MQVVSGFTRQIFYGARDLLRDNRIRVWSSSRGTQSAPISFTRSWDEKQNDPAEIAFSTDLTGGGSFNIDALVIFKPLFPFRQQGEVSRDSL